MKFIYIPLIALAVLVLPVFASNSYTSFEPVNAPQQRGNVARVQGVVVEYSEGRVGEPLKGGITMKSNGKRCVVDFSDNTRLIMDYEKGVGFKVSEPMSDMFIVSRSELDTIDEFREVGRENMFSWGCMKYEFEQNGHYIQLWMTEELGFGGSFSQDYNMGSEALILRVIVDGSYIVEATSLERYTLQDLSLESSLEDLL